MLRTSAGDAHGLKGFLIFKITVLLIFDVLDYGLAYLVFL